MPQNDNYTLVDLPEGLRRQFEKVEQRLWRVETTTAVCGIAASLLFSWLAVFVSDRLWETPVWLRVFIFLCGLGGAAAAILAWARHWVWRRRDMRALATLVQKKYRRLGDRLLGIVELANEREHLSNFSPALYHAAIGQVAEEAQKFDFRQSVNARPAKNFGWTAAGLTLCLLAASLALPQASWNAFLRWIEPGANVQRYTLVVLDGFQRKLIVPHGEPFEISGTVRYRSFWKPSRVLAWFGREAKTQTAVQSGQVRLQIPGQVEDGVLKVRVGDALAQVAILPNHRPSLQQLSASIHLPDYLRYPDQSQPVQGGSFRALEGSRVSFVGTVSRPLAAASMQSGGQDPAALKVQGPTFSTEPAEAAGAGELVFNWRDELGLTNAAPWRLALQRESDQPPQPDLPDLPRTTAMLATDVMRIRAEAQDDFGVRDLGLAWDVVSEAGQTDSMSTEIKAEMTSAQQKKVEDVFLWSPALYRIPADSTVELQGFAQDYFPKRERARTASYVIRVLSPESHAELLRQDLEALMAQIEDITRLQEKIVSDTRDVKESSTRLARRATLRPPHPEPGGATAKRATPGGIEPPGRKHRARSHEELPDSRRDHPPVEPDLATVAGVVRGKDAGGRPGHAVRGPGCQGPATAAKAPLHGIRLPNRRSRRTPIIAVAEFPIAAVAEPAVSAAEFPIATAAESPITAAGRQSAGGGCQEARTGTGGGGETRGGSPGGSSENGAKGQPEPGSIAGPHPGRTLAQGRRRGKRIGRAVDHQPGRHHRPAAAGFAGEIPTAQHLLRQAAGRRA